MKRTLVILDILLAIPLLFVGFWSLTYPVLDMLPFPASSQSAFFELWIIGIPATVFGLGLLRRGVRGGEMTRRRIPVSLPVAERGPSRPESHATDDGPHEL